MEPKLPAPNFGPERSSANYGHAVEHMPLPPNPEIGRERAPEQVEQRSETSAAENTTPILPPPIAIPQPSVSVVNTTTPVASDDDLPLVANDDDLIEKEWVDKAKKIIVETKDDPYRREQEVGKLQADYLRKRYGKELGVSE